MENEAENEEENGGVVVEEIIQDGGDGIEAQEDGPAKDDGGGSGEVIEYETSEPGNSDAMSKEGNQPEENEHFTVDSNRTPEYEGSDRSSLERKESPKSGTGSMQQDNRTAGGYDNTDGGSVDQELIKEEEYVNQINKDLEEQEQSEKVYIKEEIQDGRPSEPDKEPDKEPEKEPVKEEQEFVAQEQESVEPFMESSDISNDTELEKQRQEFEYLSVQSEPFNELKLGFEGPIEPQMEPPNTMRYEETGCDWQSDVNFKLPPVRSYKPEIQTHEQMYRPASRYLRNPFYQPEPFCPKMCCEPGQWVTSSNYAGPDRRLNRYERNWNRYRCVENTKELLMRPNPAVAVPMLPRKFKKKTPSRKNPPEEKQEWYIRAQQEKAKKDHQRAQKMGYETLVGNLVYYNIPGAKDLNRSWNHFLDHDPMTWGFPYAKGSRERSRLPLPSPYLVHQLREGFWRWPRNKFIAYPSTPATDD